MNIINYKGLTNQQVIDKVKPLANGSMVKLIWADGTEIVGIKERILMELIRRSPRNVIRTERRTIY